MIIELENFFDDKICDYMISIHQNSVIDEYHLGSEVVYLTDLYPVNYTVRYIMSKLTYIAQDTFNSSNIFPNYTQIVKRESCGQPLHKDFLYHFCTSIFYLNDNFEGGETIIDDEVFTPNKRKLILFNGSQHAHQVKDIISGTRYTMTTWFCNYESIEEN